MSLALAPYGGPKGLQAHLRLSMSERGWKDLLLIIKHPQSISRGGLQHPMGPRASQERAMKHVLEDYSAEHVASELCHGGVWGELPGAGTPWGHICRAGMQRGFSWAAGAWPNPGTAGRGVCQAGTWPHGECAPGGRAGSPARCRLPHPHPTAFLGFVLPFPERELCLLEEMQLTAPLPVEDLSVPAL